MKAFSKKMLAVLLSMIMISGVWLETNSVVLAVNQESEEVTEEEKVCEDDSVSGNDTIVSQDDQEDELVGDAAHTILLKYQSGVEVSIPFTDVQKNNGDFYYLLQKAADIAAGYLQDGAIYYADRATYASSPKATASNKCTISVPKGTYIFKSSVWIYSNTTLSIPGVTFMRPDGTSNHSFLMVGMKRGEIQFAKYEVENVSIIGGKESKAVFDGGYQSGEFLMLAHSQNVLISDIIFQKVTNAHQMELAACKDMTIQNCTFSEFKLANNETTNFEALQLDILLEAHYGGCGIYDGTTNQNITIVNNTFKNLNRGVGTHSGIYGRYFDKITISNNTFDNMVGYAIITTNYTNAEICDNTITDSGCGILFNGIRRANYYAGDANNVSINHNSVIKNNKITVTNKNYDISIYGIRLSGENVKTPTDISYKDDNGNRVTLTLPVGDYRVKGVEISGNTVTMKTPGSGIWFAGALNSTVENNTVLMDSAGAIEDSQSDAIRVVDDSDAITVKGNMIKNTGKNMLRNGISVRVESQDTVIEDNTIANAGANAIYVTETGSGKTVINRNTIVNSGNNGIYINSGAVVGSITGNTITDSAEYGIDVNSESKVSVIENNVIKKSSKTVSANRGIGIMNQSTAGSLKGNTINSVTEHGIVLGASSKVDSLSDNIVSSAAVCGIYVNSGATVTNLTGNSVSDTNGNGIYINSGSSVQNVLRNTVVKSTGNGIYLNDKSSATLVDSNKVMQSSINGIYSNASSVLSILSNNTISDVTLVGIGAKDATIDKIMGNIIVKDKNAVSAKRGILIQGSKSVVSVMDKNTISDTKEYAVNLTNSAYAKQMNNNTITNAGFIGVYINNKAKVGKINANSISKASKYGIGISSTKGKATINDNVISACKNAGIYVLKGAVPSSIKNNTVKVSKGGYSFIVGSAKKVSTKIKISKISCKKKIVTLKWNKASEATEYIVYRSTKKTGKYTKVATIDAKGNNATNYTDKKAPKKTCYYKIAVVTKADNIAYEAAPSAAKSVKVK